MNLCCLCKQRAVKKKKKITFIVKSVLVNFFLDEENIYRIIFYFMYRKRSWFLNILISHKNKIQWTDFLIIYDWIFRLNFEDVLWIESPRSSIMFFKNKQVHHKILKSNVRYQFSFDLSKWLVKLKQKQTFKIFLVQHIHYI